jgi:hypothetical protein
VILLSFRHDSTTSEWQFDGMDERALRQMLGDLAPYSAPPDSDQAVLTASVSGGNAIGAWTRGGAAHLASLMFRERTTPPWSEVGAAIQSAVMDPHLEDESAPAA